MGKNRFCSGKLLSILYCALVLGICLIPFAGMLFWPTMRTTENTELAKWPALTGEDGVNMDFLQEAGEYFTDHFAFRQELVAADARIRSAVFGTSPVDSVIVGKNGWLYYEATLDDFQHNHSLSDRMLFNIAHNLALMQEYARSLGQTFVFTIAPNKNSLYGENMPARYQYRIAEESDAERLVPWLEQEGVSYVDLYALFEGQKETLYYARDSHWNQKGAALVTDALLQACGRKAPGYAASPLGQTREYLGDLNLMVYPVGAQPEEETLYAPEGGWTYLQGDDVEDDYIQTASETGNQNLLMYRDSFGNSLLPFFAREFKQATFSKFVPYRMEDLITAESDVVILEKVERHLPTLGSVPPLMSAPQRKLPGSGEKTESDTTLHLQKEGSYWRFSGVADPRYMREDSPILLEITDGAQTRVFEAFCVQLTEKGEKNDYGFTLYLPMDQAAGTEFAVRVLTGSEGDVRILYEGKTGESGR